MPAENDFLPFAAASGANVLDQASYAAASATATGFVSGTASSAAVNKTLRQASIMAAAIAKFIVNEIDADVIDDGTLDTIIANFVLAIRTANPSAGGTVTGVSGNAPITSSGGTTPAIGISAATESAAGSMSAADKTKLDSLSADSAVLHKAGAETATGVKTFPQVIAAPASDPDTRGCLVKPAGATAYAALGAIAAYGAYVTANLYYDGSWHLVDTSKKGAYLGVQWNSGTFYFGTSPSGTASVTNAMSVDISGNASFSGTVTATGYNTSSDPRLKSNLQPQALYGDVSTIGLWTWEWTSESGRAGQGAGVRSDEVRSVFPQCVDVDDEGFDVVDYGKLGVHLGVTANRRIRELEQRLATLESRT